MTRTTCFSTLSCAALVAAFTAFGCGSSTPVATGTGGKTGGAGGTTTAGGQGGSTTTGSQGGAPGAGLGGAPGTGAGGAPGGRPDGGGNQRPDAGPAVDAGVNMCTAGTACTMGFTCRATCMVAGNAGGRACTCGGNGRLNCPGNCMLDDAGVIVPPPPVDAAPRPDAGPICANRVANGVGCMEGVDTPCARVRGNNTTMCTCGAAVDASADAGGVWTCM